MSHTALRRVAIRLLHDPALVVALHAEPLRALAGASLSADEIAWLMTVPVAAWRTDPARSERLSRALTDEFPASMCLAPERATRFFSSPHFHAVVQDRGSLAENFASYMAEDPDPRVGALAVLEGAAAAVRRAPKRHAESPPGHRRTAPHARVVRVRCGAPALLEALRRGGPQPPLGIARDDLLVLRDPATSEVTIESLSLELRAILHAASMPTPLEQLVARACSLGAQPTEAMTMLDDLVAAAILV
jgi:hypothetical protein